MSEGLLVWHVGLQKEGITSCRTTKRGNYFMLDNYKSGKCGMSYYHKRGIMVCH